MKRIISFLLIIMSLAQISVGAATINGITHSGTNTAYLPGEITYKLDLSDYDFVNNGSAEKSVDDEYEMNLGENGSATYKFYMPFNSESVNFNTFSTNPANITVSIGGETATFESKGLTAHYMDKVRMKFSMTFEKIQNMGDAEITISTDKPVLIKDVIFNKEKRPATPGSGNPTTRYTEYEAALFNSVVINNDSPIIKVSNGLRYVNYDNPQETPLVEDGRTYLPLSTFARAMSCYYEENVSKSWMLLRNKTESVEIALKDGKLYKQSNLGNYTEIENIVKLHNGKYYVPIRYFAEIMGNTVNHKDGYTAIGYRDLVRKVLAEPVFSQVKEEFASYKRTPNNGRVYHVAQTSNASDANDGSAERPFLTLNKAGEVAQAGDRVIVHGGTYREVFNPKNNGTASNPIVFEAAEGEKPVISALEEVGAPEGTEGDMLVYNTGIDMGYGRNMVFYENEALAEGRHPNADNSKHALQDIDLGPLWKTQGNIQVKGKNRPSYDFGPEAENYAVSDTDLDQEKDYWKGGTLVSHHGSGWILTMAKIVGSEPGKIYLGNPQDETCTLQWWYPDSKETDYGYITCTKNAVDIPGEWYAEGGKLWIIPPEGTNADTLKIQMKARQLCVDLNDRQYVQLKNISTIGGGTRMDESKLCVLNGGEYRYISHYTFSLDQWTGYFDDANRYSDNGAPQRGESGIYLGGDSCAVLNTKIQWSAAAGIYSPGTYAYVENNLIEDTGYMGSYVAGFYDSWAGSTDIRTPRSGNLIVNNTINKVGRALYHLETAQNGWNISEGHTPYIATEVAYNDMLNGSLTARDTGVVYVYGGIMGSDQKHHDIHHNIVSNSWSSDGFNAGIYYDNWVSQADCHDNLVFSTNENSKFSDGRGVYYQSKAMFPNAWSTVDIWNNRTKNYVPGGKESLTADEYPSYKIFRTGCNLSGEEYLENYNTFNPTAKEASADNAALGKGVNLENGIARFSGANQTMTFKDVDFGEGKNALDLTFTTEWAKTGDKVEISIGSKKFYVSMYGVARDDKKYNSLRIPIDGVSGVQNVTIKTLTFNSLGMVKIKPLNDNETVNDGVYGKTFFGHYDEVIKQNGGMNVTKKVFNGDNSQEGIMNGWGEQTVIRYDNVGISEDVTKFVLAAGSGGQYAGGTISVRIGSEEAEPIGSAVVPELPGWSPVGQTPVEAPLTETLKAGTYTVYVTFHTSGKCADCWFFGFGK